MCSMLAKVIKTVVGGGKVVTQNVGSAAASGLANGLAVGTQVALNEGTQGMLRAATHAAKQTVREMGEAAVEAVEEVPKGIVGMVGLGGASINVVGTAARAAQVPAAELTKSLKLPKPIQAVPPVAGALESTVVEAAEVLFEVGNTAYEGVVMQGGMNAAAKIKSGILGGS